MNPNEDDPDWQAWLNTRGLQKGAASEDLVPLPSGGTFAEAVLGRYNCAEKLDMTRFWNWQDSPIPLLPSDIAAIQSGQHDTSDDTKTGQLGAPIINVSAPTTLPEPTGLAAILAAIQNGNMFQDTSGSQGTFQLAGAATNAATSGAMSAGQIAGQNLANQLQASTEMQRIAAQKELGMAQLLTGASANKGTRNISQDGAKVNYFDKTQADPSESGPFSDPGDRYSQNPAARTALWGDPLPTSDLLGKMVNPWSYQIDEWKRSPELRAIVERARKEAEDWADLLAFTPNEDLLEDLRIRGMKVHYLEKALGDLVNLDHYAVEIIRLPSLAGKQLTEKELLSTVGTDERPCGFC